MTSPNYPRISACVEELCDASPMGRFFQHLFESVVDKQTLKQYWVKSYETLRENNYSPDVCYRQLIAGKRLDGTLPKPEEGVLNSTCALALSWRWLKLGTKGAVVPLLGNSNSHPAFDYGAYYAYSALNRLFMEGEPNACTPLLQELETSAQVRHHFRAATCRVVRDTLRINQPGRGAEKTLLFALAPYLQALQLAFREEKGTTADECWQDLILAGTDCLREALFKHETPEVRSQEIALIRQWTQHLPQARDRGLHPDQAWEALLLKTQEYWGEVRLSSYGRTCLSKDADLPLQRELAEVSMRIRAREIAQSEDLRLMREAACAQAPRPPVASSPRPRR